MFYVFIYWKKGNCGTYKSKLIDTGMVIMFIDIGGTYSGALMEDSANEISA